MQVSVIWEMLLTKTLSHKDVFYKKISQRHGVAARKNRVLQQILHHFRFQVVIKCFGDLYVYEIADR
jgi:hypothetical protein